MRLVPQQERQCYSRGISNSFATITTVSHRHILYPLSLVLHNWWSVTRLWVHYDCISMEYTLSPVACLTQLAVSDKAAVHYYSISQAYTLSPVACITQLAVSDKAMVHYYCLSLAYNLSPAAYLTQLAVSDKAAVHYYSISPAYNLSPAAYLTQLAVSDKAASVHPHHMGLISSAIFHHGRTFYTLSLSPLKRGHRPFSLALESSLSP